MLPSVVRVAFAVVAVMTAEVRGRQISTTATTTPVMATTAEFKGQKVNTTATTTTTVEFNGHKVNTTATTKTTTEVKGQKVNTTATAEVKGQKVNTTATTLFYCPFPFEEKDGLCVHRKEVEEAIRALRKKRQAVVTTTCPKCVSGVFDLYPMWEDCSKLNYCLNGQIIPLDCRHFNASYFNPVTKACETTANANNICIYRSSTALLG